MKLVTTFADARRLGRGVVGLVPTMGYLHEGHLSLVAAARSETDTVTMSLFVNPLQFGEGEDLDRYPRDLDGDAALAADAGVDVLFAPDLDEMYPSPPVTRVVVAAMSGGLEGTTRPGHFDGVATVVTKLLAGVQPHRAYFGRKDAQQLAVVRRLVHDLSIPVEIVGCPIIRDASGLALSSRNAYLTDSDRTAALGLWRGLMAAADAAEAGERHGATLERIARTGMEAADGVRIDYVALSSVSDVRRLPSLDEPAFLAVAARVGSTRLIDNIHLDPGPPVTADRGVTLTGPGLDRSQGDG